MFKYILCLFLVLVPSFVVAQESVDEESLTPEEQSKQFCETRFSGTGSTDVLKRILCIQHEHTRILEARQKRGEAGLEQKLAELRKQLEATKADLAKQAQASPNPNPPPGPASDPAPTPQPPQGPSLPAFVNGVPFGVIETPGQFAATTWDVQGAQTLGIENLSSGARHWVRGADQVRVVLKKNGVVIPVANQDKTFNEFYADLNRDGKPDSRPYAGVDPFAIDQVFVSQVGKRDKVEVIYLVPTGRLVTISGLPAQILWGEPLRVEMGRVERLGQWKMHATTAWRIW